MFKEKSSKKRIITSESSKDYATLDARHQQMMDSLQDKHQQCDSLESERKKCKDAISQWTQCINTLKEAGNTESEEYSLAWTSNLHFRECLEELTSQIDRTHSFCEEIEYYENTAPILFQYYDLLQRQDDGATAVNVPNAPTRPSKGRKKTVTLPTRSILDAFGIGAVSKNDTPITAPAPAQDTSVDKSSLVDAYMSQMDCSFLRHVAHDSGMCTKCPLVPLLCLHQEGVLVCPECGYQELLLVEQNRPILRQSNKDASHFSYKRINHFREWCSQVQGKETTDIPEEIFEKILAEIKKEKIADLKKINYQKIREILKKLKLNRYYEHSYYIIYRISGVPPPQFSPELEEKLCIMFKEIQGPFLVHCPPNRKNFLSYSYVLYKLFQILGQTNTEYLKFLTLFQLHRDRVKTVLQDQIFMNICTDLGWPFIPSV